MISIRKIGAALSACLAVMASAGSALAGGTTAPALPNTYSFPGASNWGPQQNGPLLQCLADVSVTTVAKTACRIAIVGDSTSAGHCAIAGSPCIDSRASSWSYQLAAMLAASGAPVTTDSWWGCSNETSVSACMTFDPRLSVGTGWTLLSQTGIGSFGAIEFPANTTPTDLTFTGSQPYNQADIYLINGTAAASFSVDRAGSAPSSSTVVASTGSACTVSGATVTTASGSLGHCLVRFTWATTAAGGLDVVATSNATGKFYIEAQSERDINSPKIEFYNMSIGGSSSVSWYQPGVSGYNAYALAGSNFANPLVTFNVLGINDWNSPTTALATYQSNMTAMQAQANSTGENIFIMGMQSNPASFASVATQAQYGAITQALAAEANQPWINFQYRWTNWVNGCALGFYGSNSGSCDGRHGSAMGYNDQARMIFGLMAPLIANSGPTAPALQGFTVANLPASGNVVGQQVYVTNATACTSGSSPTGGGSTFCTETWNGTAWVH